MRRPLERVLSAALLAAACAGCANLPGAQRWSELESRLVASDALQYWLEAAQADARGQERLWKDARRRKSEWQLGLLQSLPGSGRYDAAAARKRLRAVLDGQPSSDVAAVAKLRLLQLAEDEELRTQVGSLQRRLDKVVAIERRMER